MFSSVWLYHYTDRRSARYIPQTRKIHASNDIEVDEKLQRGVYLTDMTTSDHSLEEIAFNNWQHRLTISIRQELEYCIRVKFLENEIQCYCKDGRPIFFFEGQNQNLNLKKIQNMPARTREYFGFQLRWLHRFGSTITQITVLRDVSLDQG